MLPLNIYLKEGRHNVWHALTLQLGAFGKKEYLEAYSIRWSPSRALGYTSILVDLRKHLAEFLPRAINPPKQNVAAHPSPASSPQSSLQTICFGGGAAEVVGFGGFLRYLHTSTSDPESTETAALDALQNLSVSSERARADLVLIDTAPWKDVIQKLHTALITPPPLSKYASASARAANTSLLEIGDLSSTFIAKDILELSEDQLGAIVGKTPMLVTLFFTLNELYTTSIGKTTAFLLNLTAAVPSSTLLLVVDSPGSYSEATIGTEAKKYPMLWLLNHTLLETEKSRGQESAASWKTLVSEESQWFRMPEKLRYPIKLESMRYQCHLYRRT